MGKACGCPADAWHKQEVTPVNEFLDQVATPSGRQQGARDNLETLSRGGRGQSGRWEMKAEAMRVG